MKYGFLLGQRFRVRKQLFEAADVMQLDANRTVVKGISLDAEKLTRNFPAHLVVEALVFEEEIEIASASW